MKKTQKSAPKSDKSSEAKSVSTKKNAGSDAQTMEELLSQVGYDFKGFKKGDQVSGTVSAISGKQVLLDFGGKTEGIVGEKEWEQIKDFVSTLKVGDPIDAIVISTENDRGQMVVSIRKAGSKYRWQHADELLKSGNSINVRGLEVNKGGLVVDFEGLKGFIPGSQFSGDQQADLAKMVNKIIAAKVIEVDQAQNRLILSEKAISGGKDLEKKLADVKSKVKIADKYTGKVSAIMPYGIFVNLDNGADGLVHISEVSWQKVDSLQDRFKVGDELEVLVLGISETDGKLNLSLKQLQPDPWIKLSEKYSTDQQVKGEVTRLSPYGVFVRLDDGIEGLIHISKVPADTSYEVGQSVNCTIESIDVAAHRISLVPVLTVKPVGYK